MATKTILATFDPQVAKILPNKFQDYRPFRSGEDAQTDFQNGSQGGHLGFQIGTILAIVLIYKSPRRFQVSSQLAQGCRRSRLSKQIVEMARRTMQDAH